MSPTCKPSPIPPAEPVLITMFTPYCWINRLVVIDAKTFPIPERTTITSWLPNEPEINKAPARSHDNGSLRFSLKILTSSSIAPIIPIFIFLIPSFYINAIAKKTTHNIRITIIRDFIKKEFHLVVFSRSLILVFVIGLFFLLSLR